MSMQDTRLIFSDNESITGTGPDFSTNLVDLEEYSVADQQITGWLCFRVVANSSFTVSEGLSVRLMDRDDTSFAGDGTLDANEKVIAAIELIAAADLADGDVHCAGFLMDDLRRYLRVQYYDNGGAKSGTLNVDCWIQDRPVTKLKTQKMPT